MRQSFDAKADSHARDAAIAAMGQRLAAAGRRTRPKVPQPTLALPEPQDPAPAAPRAPMLVAHRSQAFVRDVAPIVPPPPRRRMLTAIGRVAALASMASAGFAVVLLAQSPRWSAHRGASPKAVAAIAQDEPPAPPVVVGPDIPAAQLAENDVTQPAPIAAPPAASVPAAHVSPILQPPSAPPQPAATPPRQKRPVQVQLAAFARPQHVAAKPVQIAIRESASHPRPEHTAALARYALPRWLTAARDTPPRPVILSPPPHDLEAPTQVAAAAEKQRIALPPLPRPRLIYASAGYYAAPPPAGPAYGYERPAYPPAPYNIEPAQPYAQ